MIYELTADDKKYIKLFFSVRTLQEIAEELGISIQFVQAVVIELGLLKKEDNHYQELALVDPEKLVRHYPPSTRPTR